MCPHRVLSIECRYWVYEHFLPSSTLAHSVLKCVTLEWWGKDHGVYSQSRYPKGQSNEKKTTKDCFEFLLHLLFHDYNRLVYDYNYNDFMLI